MTRREKYPDTSTFTFNNVNPKSKATSDCVVRAISLATEQPYKDVLRALVELQLKTGYANNDPRCYGKYLENLGWRKRIQPRKSNGTKYTGEQFCKLLKKHQGTTNRIVAHIGGHHVTAIINSKVNDIWDCTDGCIGNYWEKDLQGVM